MTTFLYNTTSGELDISKQRDEVNALLSEYYFTVEPTIKSGSLVFHGDQSAFGVYESSDQREEREVEFFEQLGNLLSLDSDFTVKCVEVQGEGEPVAYSWTVMTDGSVEFNEL